MKPVVDDFRKRQDRAIDTLHVLSDGPATQYRDRANCFLMSSVPYTRGFKRVTWNFSEHSHGKGAPDGVGGVYNRKADMHVLGGSDLQTPRDLFECLQQSTENVTANWIEEEHISAMDDMLPLVSASSDWNQQYTSSSVFFPRKHILQRSKLFLQVPSDLH